MRVMVRDAGYGERCKKGARKLRVLQVHSTLVTLAEYAVSKQRMSEARERENVGSGRRIDGTGEEGLRGRGWRWGKEGRGGVPSPKKEPCRQRRVVARPSFRAAACNPHSSSEALRRQPHNRGRRCRLGSAFVPPSHAQTSPRTRATEPPRLLPNTTHRYR